MIEVWSKYVNEIMIVKNIIWAKDYDEIKKNSNMWMRLWDGILKYVDKDGCCGQ